MADFAIRIAGEPVRVNLGENTVAAIAARTAAAESAAFAEEFSGPAYATVAAGEAATTAGQFFRVPVGTTPETYTRYQRTATGSVVAASLATTSNLASTDADKGAALVGYQQSGGKARTLKERASELIHVTDYNSLAEAVAAAPSGSAIFCPAGYSETVSATIPIGKDLKIFAHNWRTVTITGPANAPIFEANGTAVTNFILEGITWVGGAGTSQLLKVPTGSSWVEGKCVVQKCKINNFGDFAIERGDSVYLTEIKGNRFDNCVGCISEGWASDSTIDDNLFNDLMAGNPVMRLEGGSRTIVSRNDFIRAGGTIATEADIELNPSSTFGRGGRVYIHLNKFGGEMETHSRPKIRTYNATTGNRSTDVIIVCNQFHGANFSEGGTAHCFQLDNPIAGWVVENNEFDELDLIVQDNVVNFESFLGSNQWGQNRYFWSTRRQGKLFLNGGRMFTDVEEPVFGYQLPKIGYEPREARNRIQYSSAITSWNKSTGVTITGGQSDPDGGTNAFLIENNGAAVAQNASRVITTAGMGESCILKLRLRAQVSTKVQVGIKDYTVSPSRYVGMNQVLVLDGKWRDYEFTISGLVAANVNVLEIYPAGSTSVAIPGGFYIYQPQISDFDSDYIPTPSSVGVVDATIGRRFSKKVSLAGGAKATIPTYADNAAALAGGLLATDIYKTATGEVRVVV